jgi:hypothetical protein
MSVGLINKFSDCGSGSLAPHHNEKDPKCNTIANKKIHSTALGRLEKETSISSNLMRSMFIEEASKHHGEAKKPAATAKPAPATAMTAQPQFKSIATDSIAAQCVPPIPPEDAPTAGTQIPFQDAHPAATIPLQATDNQTERQATENQTELLLPTIPTVVKNLQNNKEKCQQEDVRKQTSHVAYELVTILKDSEERVFFRSDRAGGLSWKQEVHSRGGNSERSIQQVSKHIRDTQTNCTSKMSKVAWHETLAKKANMHR